MVDADVTQAYADGRVPNNISYITPDYLSESRDGQAIAGIIVVFVITTILLCCRFFSRVFVVKSFGLDDWLAVVSYIGFTTFMALSLILIDEGSGRHIEYIQYVLPSDEVNTTEVMDYAGHLIYTATLWFCRLSGLAFFNRLCDKHRTFRIAIWASIGFLTASFLVQFFLILLHCSPTTGLWPYAWQAESSNYVCLNWGVVYVTNSGLSLVCDFVIFSIPTAMIIILQLPASRKAVLSVVLLPGTLVIGISCARLWLCVVGQWRSDGSWYYDPQLAIEVAEIGGTLIALSVPSLKPMLSQWYSSMRSTIDRSREQGSQYARASSNIKGSNLGTWDPPSTDVKMKTMVKGTPTRNSRGSDSDDSLLYPGAGDIYVTRDVDMRSMPAAHIRESTA